jgi:hypothetical protein
MARVSAFFDSEALTNARLSRAFIASESFIAGMGVVWYADHHDVFALVVAVFYGSGALLSTLQAWARNRSS